MGYALCLPGSRKYSAGPRECEERGKGNSLSPGAARSLHPTAKTGRHGPDCAGGGIFNHDGTRSRGVVSRRRIDGLLRPERSGVASAEGGGAAELLRLFGSARGSAAERLAQGDGV